MPRPGPRPYECVRRAWHSDRHQPIRGSLIQEIFRLVNEVHSSSTKKNKEWQEKLPIVVLKAEEIMYSKANSEAEYMDLNTLWDRSNDAINTIIRRDESTETGDLLQPCIEAALCLGCTPRRTSRSQRNCHPRCYLIPGTQDPNHFSPGTIVEPHSRTNSQCLPKFSNIIISPTHPRFRLQTLVSQNTCVSAKEFPFPMDNWHLSNYNQLLPMENCPVLSLCSVYPLYYGSCLESQNCLGMILNSVPSSSENVTMGVEQRLFSSNAATADVRIKQLEFKDCLMDQQGVGCDLSLRLGSLSTPSPSVRYRQLGDVEDVSYGHSQELSKFNNPTPKNDKEFTFFSRVDTETPREYISVGSSMKKRMTIFRHLMNDQAYNWHQKLQCDDLTGKMKSTEF